MRVTSPCEPQVIDAVSPRRAVTVPRRRTGGGERGDVAEGLKAWRWEGRTRGVWSDILFFVSDLVVGVEVWSSVIRSVSSAGIVD
jgi:hypothetical protein